MPYSFKWLNSIVKIKHFEIEYVEKRSKENTQDFIITFTGASGIKMPELSGVKH